MIEKIGSMVLVAGIIVNAARVFLGVEKGEVRRLQRENIRMADFMIFPERILASNVNVPASW